jgi:dTDP-4-dehydrorhamnose reductase
MRPARIAVIGATGALGRCFVELLGERAIAMSRDDLDVTDSQRVGQTVHALHPDWIVNTSAFHRLEDCEIDCRRAFDVNAAGAAHVARAAADVGAGVLWISTDHVFSGAGRPRATPFVESDATDPLSVYAISKVAGERLVAQRNERHIVVRTAGLYGWHASRKGWAFPDLMIRKALAGEILRVVHDQVTSPSFTLHVARTAIALIDAGARGLFHVTNSGECSWYELARRTLDLAGIRSTVVQTETLDGPGAARRPCYSPLASERLREVGVAPLPPWDQALAEYVAGRVL